MQIAFPQAYLLHASDDAFKIHSTTEIFHASFRLTPYGLAGVPQA
jgi:hypothetical protein